jgi:hypothetical protein
VSEQINSQSKLLHSLLAAFLGDDVATAQAKVSSVAGYELSEAQGKPFADFTRWINTRPSFIAKWRSDPKTERIKYLRFMEGMESCRTGYSACLYHMSRLREMENAVHSILEQYDFSRSIPKGTVAAVGNMKKCDFEYQAFVMAFRRSLDGMAWGLSTYFNVDQSSYNRFAKTLSKLEPKAVAAALQPVFDSRKDAFKFVVGSERGMSLRDRMAHKEAVQSGTINLGSFGHKIIGGGDNLGLDDLSSTPPRLSTVLEQRLEVLHSFANDVYRTFENSATHFE